jgi:hypothetical protein
MMQWIGVNTQYLTQSVATSTVGNVPVTTTMDVHISVETASVAAGGVEAGDVVVTISEPLAHGLDDAVKNIVAACGGAKVRKRQGEFRRTCLVSLRHG